VYQRKHQPWRIVESYRQEQTPRLEPNGMLSSTNLISELFKRNTSTQELLTPPLSMSNHYCIADTKDTSTRLGITMTLVFFRYTLLPSMLTVHAPETRKDTEKTRHKRNIVRCAIASQSLLTTAVAIRLDD
jgi:hypothetical protein